MRAMNKIKKILSCTLGLCLLLPASAQRQKRQDDSEELPDPRDLEKPVTQFERKLWNVAANLYQEVKKTESGNFILSPLSLTTAMAMLNAGAARETAREIQSTFKFGTSSEFTTRNQTQILTSLKNQPVENEAGVELLTASRIFANEKNANLRQNYVRAVSSFGDVETLDFSEPEQVVAEINEWVKTQTHGKISKIGGAKDFDKETSAVLLDTLYFKAPWKFPFNTSDTYRRDFYVSDNKRKRVDMMHISAEFPHVDLEDVEATATFLPYQGDRFSMVIYLPWKERELSTLEEKLVTLVPSEVRNKATTTEIDLYLPKFNMSSSLDFKQILTSLGVERMFNRTVADFSKMTASPEFHVSKLVQQVFIEVNEEGAEPTAVTEARGLAPVSAPNIVRVDRPFIFQIYDSVSGAVLLSARVTNPNGKKPAVINWFEKRDWQLATTLFKEAKKTEVGNLVFSPLTLTTSMVMLNAGAGGETAREIQTLFQFGTNSKFTIQNQTELLNSLTNQTTAQGEESGVKLLTASRIYTDIRNAKLRKNYVRAVSSLGEVDTLDFTEPEQVVDEINEWVKTQTQGKISKIVQDEDFDKETGAVLLDTLYFKAQWKTPFNQSYTQTADFHVSENETEEVDMMIILEEFPYANLEEAQASAVFLPYQGDRFNMIIYLPYRGWNLSILEEKLETSVPSQILNEATTEAIALYLPKFNMSSSIDFKEILTSLGVQKMFKRDEANFTKISESPQLHVSKVRQNIFIEVNEGTEDAAVRDVHGLEALFVVDRPFIFQIYDSLTGAVLVSGRVTNPNGFVETKSSYEASQKWDVEKLFLDFASLLAPKETEINLSPLSNLTSRASRLQVLADKYGNKTRGAMKFIQRVNNTLTRLEETEEQLKNLTNSGSVQAQKISELEQKEKKLKGEMSSKNERITELKEKVKTLNSTLSQKPNEPVCPVFGNKTETKLEEPQGNFLPAAAYGYFSGLRSPWSWNYSATANGPCFTFDRPIFSVYIKGSACVAFYKGENCTQEKFQMDTTNLTLVQDVEIPFKIAKTSKSVGVCSCF